jgi:YD repeat-containing protein
MFSRYLMVISTILLLASLSNKVCAQTFSLPSTNTTGSYTITYTFSGMGALVIEELLPNGAWQAIGGGSSSGAIAVTKTQSGTYSYRSRTCMSSCSVPSATKTITVTLGPANPVVCTGAPNTITYCYDDLGRVKTVIHPNGVKNKYEYDAADNRTKKESTTN